MATLRPFGNNILFKFLDETGGSRGEFSERSRSGLIIPKLQNTQKGERWGEVLAAGPDAGVEVGEYILIEPLMWTRNEVFEGQKIWKTNADKVMALTSDVALTVQY
jgi:co-chaperonin GroES (HSP10)